MPRYHYGTVPALAWLLNHYFYGGVHYSWLAEEFAPLRTNPKSSNPYLIYGDLYWAWSHADQHDRFCTSLRDSLSNGVDAQYARKVVTFDTSRRLMNICSNVEMKFFYPVVYRVDMNAIVSGRQEVAGSGLTGSREVLVTDLRETEFDLLFADNLTDADFGRLILDEREGVRRNSPADVL
ncbi:MAG: hypothetical protein JO306_07480 [Gemmatimonadetes bacterium]|nr:hypothetical protein [Gemmatimonadota bacterium]